MRTPSLSDLQESVRDKSAFQDFADYQKVTEVFLGFLSHRATRPTKIVSTSHNNYVFYQYSSEFQNKISRPLNTELFILSSRDFARAFQDFQEFLGHLKRTNGKAASSSAASSYLKSKEINKVVYTIQQSIGCIGDSFENANQSRKRIGQLFENAVRLLIQAVGASCEPRTIKLPIPGHKGASMSYELDLVFSRKGALIASETRVLQPSEIVGSVKTTSKDRIDKVFLDKFLLTKLLGVNVPVVAIFLHDVQRAKRGNSIFGINSTFKSNHFLGYTVALNRLDGVYYVDPRPEMTSNPKLREQISDFQTFLTTDLWKLTDR